MQKVYVRREGEPFPKDAIAITRSNCFWYVDITEGNKRLTIRLPLTDSTFTTEESNAE